MGIVREFRDRAASQLRPRALPCPMLWPALQSCPPAHRFWSTGGLRCWQSEFSSAKGPQEIRVIHAAFALSARKKRSRQIGTAVAKPGGAKDGVHAIQPGASMRLVRSNG